MKKRIIILCILFLFLCSQVWAAVCGGDIPCACGDTVTSSYTLPADLNCTNSGNGFAIGANDVEIDLNGYTLSGDDTNTLIGIYANNRTGLVIKNGTIEDFVTTNTQLIGTTTATVTNVNANSSAGSGFDSAGTATITYSNVSASDNSTDGLDARTDSNITVDGLTCKNNADVCLKTTVNTIATISDVIDSGTGEYVFRLQGSSQSTASYITTNKRIYVSGGTHNITDLTQAVSTAAVADCAGAIGVLGGGTLTISDSTITTSVATHASIADVDNGTLIFDGVIATDINDDTYYSIQVEDTTDSGGDVTIKGGSSIVGAENAVYLNSDGSTVKILGATLTAQGGHIVDTIDGDLEVSNSRFVDIDSTNSALYIQTGTDSASVQHTVFYDANKSGDGIYSQIDISVVACVFQSLVTGITRNAGTFTANYNAIYDVTTNSSGTITGTPFPITTGPLFTDPDAYNFRISTSSPLYLYGQAGTIGTNGPEHTYNGCYLYVAPYDRVNIGPDQTYSDSIARADKRSNQIVFY